MPSSPTPFSLPEHVAAVDLGSNSFHLVIAQLDNGQLKIIDRLRYTVRLGAGLTQDRRLTPAAQERALACLERFGQRLKGLPKYAVRVVGTNTLRRLRDGGEFQILAEQALGHPIEVVAGREEARLVYLGVAHGLAAGDESRLVVDIGGGSTEVIIGRGLESRARESLFMGSVSYTQKYFADGDIDQENLEEAITAGRLELRPIKTGFDANGVDRVVGSSGSIRSIRNIVLQAGWAEQGITRQALKRLRKEMLAAGHVDKLDLPGLSADRRPILPGAVAVLSAVFKTLQIEQMSVSDMALREGLLYELLGHIRHEDIRDRTVESLAQRFGVDQQQAERIENTALSLLKQLRQDWELAEPEDADVLGWAARLHEIGLVLSHNAFHKHGAYMLAHADLPGFSRRQQALLAALVRGHRRKFPNDEFEQLPQSAREDGRRLCIILRLAVLLHRGRSKLSKPSLEVTASDKCVEVKFPRDWLTSHPLTQAEMAAERRYLESAGYELVFA